MHVRVTTVCDLCAACLAVTGKSFSLLRWHLGSDVSGPTSPLPDLSWFASLHPQIRPLLLLGQRRHPAPFQLSVGEGHVGFVAARWKPQNLRVTDARWPRVCKQVWGHKCGQRICGGNGFKNGDKTALKEEGTHAGL